jgi:hypothetical protein
MVIENWIDQDFGAKARMAFLVRQDPLDWLFRVALISTPYRSRVCSLPSTERSAVQMNLTIFNPDSPEFIRTAWSRILEAVYLCGLWREVIPKVS